MKIKRTLLPFVALCAAISVLAGLGGCTSGIKAQNLMVGIVANSAQKADADKDFSRALAGFSLRLFSDTAKGGQKSGNILVSPFCVNTVLSMTANGAKGKTLEELSGALANGMDINRLNAYYNAFLAGLKEEEKCKMTSSGSIWFKDDKALNVKQDFLQKNADFYRSEIYKAKFDKSTADDKKHAVLRRRMGRSLLRQHRPGIHLPFGRKTHGANDVRRRIQLHRRRQGHRLYKTVLRRKIQLCRPSP